MTDTHLYSALGKGGVYQESFCSNIISALRDPTPFSTSTPKNSQTHFSFPPVQNFVPSQDPPVRDCTSVDSGFWSPAICSPIKFSPSPESANQTSFNFPGPHLHHYAERHFFSHDQMLEFQSLLSKPKRIVPPDYICHICGQIGHDIKECPAMEWQPRLTPYQGDKTVYGSFMCSKCKRVWGSVTSRANKMQPCVKCKLWEFPRKQLSLEEAHVQGLVYRQPDGSFKVVRRR